MRHPIVSDASELPRISIPKVLSLSESPTVDARTPWICSDTSDGSGSGSARDRHTGEARRSRGPATTSGHAEDRP